MTKDSLVKDVKEFNKRFESNLKELNLNITFDLDFYEYKTLPSDLALAIEVMNKHRFKFVPKFSRKEVKNDN